MKLSNSNYTFIIIIDAIFVEANQMGEKAAVCERSIPVVN